MGEEDFICSGYCQFDIGNHSHGSSLCQAGPVDMMNGESLPLHTGEWQMTKPWHSMTFLP